jgi:hypothetical protein
LGATTAADAAVTDAAVADTAATAGDFDRFLFFKFFFFPGVREADTPVGTVVVVLYSATFVSL